MSVLARTLPARSPSRRGHDRDARLVARIRGGDERCREQMVRAHLPTLFALCRRLAGPDSANEAVRAAFATAFRSLDRFDGSEGLRSWLRRLAVRSAIAHRTSGREGADLEARLPAFSADGHRIATPLPPAAESRPRADAARAEIERLPDDLRVVLLLHDLERLALAEIAEALALPLATIKQRLHAARLTICERLTRERESA